MLEHIEIAVAFSALGAAAHLANLYLSGTHLEPKLILSNLLISVFAAALMYLIALRLGWQVYGIGGGCGLSAWMGVKILAFFEGRFLRKFEDKNENKR
ncbi:hypothetical protein [Leclercia adecarboxylata]|uniref:hypothetical protein n=1 Tax=Leclercia adecarboxylata TaxID=83655 RepID=UPI00384C40A9